MTTDNPPSVEEVLKPFGEALKGNFTYQQDGLLLHVGFGMPDIRWKHELGDYRRAAQALAFLQGRADDFADAFQRAEHAMITCGYGSESSSVRTLREIADFLKEPTNG